MFTSIDQLRAQIAGILELEPGELPDDALLMDHGLDSMRAMNLAMQWEEDGVPLDFADLAEAPSLAQLWSLMQERQGR